MIISPKTTRAPAAIKGAPSPAGRFVPSSSGAVAGVGHDALEDARDEPAAERRRIDRQRRRDERAHRAVEAPLVREGAAAGRGVLPVDAFPAALERGERRQRGELAAV